MVKIVAIKNQDLGSDCSNVFLRKLQCTTSEQDPSIETVYVICKYRVHVLASTCIYFFFILVYFLL